MKLSSNIKIKLLADKALNKKMYMLMFKSGILNSGGQMELENHLFMILS